MNCETSNINNFVIFMSVDNLLVPNLLYIPIYFLNEYVLYSYCESRLQRNNAILVKIQFVINCLIKQNHQVKNMNTIGANDVNE